MSNEMSLVDLLFNPELKIGFPSTFTLKDQKDILPLLARIWAIWGRIFSCQSQII